MTLKRSRRKFPAVPGSEQEPAENGADHLYARVAQLAYSLYEQRGRKDGHDVEDWIQAEQTVLRQPNGRGSRNRAGQEPHDDSQRP